ncbi:MAG TPA: hypothetical protein VFZ14_15735 [Burkholderiales bacterium]|nr:hypothetical protein [Burkholderiales bacterium]
MKSAKLLLLAVVALSGAAGAAPALAHGHVRFGVVIGGPGYWYYPSPYYYYPPPYYYPPAVVTVPSSPPVYVERSEVPQSERTGGYWYYCPDSKTYYPYVKECASPWQRVDPRPPQ